MSLCEEPLDVGGLRSWFSSAMAERLGGRPPLDYALTAEAAKAMHAYVLRVRPPCILELGSGFSTLVLANASALCGAKLWTADHDDAWLGHMRALVREYEAALCPFGQVLEATVQQWRYYHGPNALAGLPPPTLVLVDHGPTMSHRLRDLPSLCRMLARGGALLLDDCREKTAYEARAAAVLGPLGFALRRLEGSRSPSGRWLGLATRRASKKL
jgi:predicted O-methyltransferase YrrM